MSGEASGPRFLVADIGGTNARFALADASSAHPVIGQVTSWTTAQCPSLALALAAFIEAAGRPELSAVAVCAAGPVTGAGAAAKVAMTNCPWMVDAGEIAQVSGGASVLLLNDFAALAMAIPALGPDDVRIVAEGKPEPGAPRAIFGAGTGLGVAALIEADGRNIVVPGEGGHADLAPSNAHELELLGLLMEGRDHVSAEHVLSGPGLLNLHRAIARLEGVEPVAVRTPEEIARLDVEGACPVCTRTIDQFCAWAGAFAGNLALTYGARGGVYIAGGIIPNWVAGRTRGRFAADLFMERFLAKGRFRSYLEGVPVRIVTRTDPALAGLVQALVEEKR
jgi:glucokinase